MEKLLMGTIEDRPITKKCYVEGEYYITLESLNTILESLICHEEVQLLVDIDSDLVKILSQKGIIHPEPKQYTYKYTLKSYDRCMQMWRELRERAG